MGGSLLNDIAGPFSWVFPAVMAAIGFLLSCFYAWLYWRSLTKQWQVEQDDTPLTIRLKWLPGWAGGACFIGGALVFVLPVGLGFLSLVVASGWVLLYFPVAGVLRH